MSLNIRPRMIGWRLGFGSKRTSTRTSITRRKRGSSCGTLLATVWACFAMTPAGNTEMTRCCRGIPTPDDSEGYIPSREIRSSNACSIRRRLASSDGESLTSPYDRRDPYWSSGETKDLWILVKISKASLITVGLAASSPALSSSPGVRLRICSKDLP